MKRLLLIACIGLQTFAFAGIIKSYVDEVNIWEFDETRGVENGEASLKTGSIEDSGETSFAIMVGGINCFDFNLFLIKLQ